jgi:hypothetical protein
MNKLTQITGLIFLTLLIFSCATMTPREKMLVGKWKPVKIENANTPEHKKTLATKTNTDTLKAKALEIKKDTGVVRFSKEEEKLNRRIQTETRTTLQINADKTATIYFPGREVNTKWKLKKQGTIFSAHNPESGHKLELELLRVNDTSVTVIERLPEGGLRIIYHKEK